jgi:hypothetical protein
VRPVAGLYGNFDGKFFRRTSTGSRSSSFAKIRRRHREFVRDRGRFDPSAVLADVESRLCELPELDPGELFDAAADLAALALAVGRSAPSDD